jgi:hypothetical protein
MSLREERRRKRYNHQHLFVVFVARNSTTFLVTPRKVLASKERRMPMQTLTLILMRTPMRMLTQTL